MLKYSLSLLFGALLCQINGSPLADPCTVSNFTDVADAAKECDVLTIKDIVIPSKTTLKIDLKHAAKLVFDGIITHEVAEWDGDLIHVTGQMVEINGTKNHLLDGLGPKHWKGDNEETILRPKLIRFTLNQATIHDLKLKNCPSTCLLLTNSTGVYASDINIDNSDGNPEVAGENFAKNTIGLDLSFSTLLKIENSVILNQDDCVVANQGTDLTFNYLYCNGSRGLFNLSVSTANVSYVEVVNSRIENAQYVIDISTHNDGDYHGSIDYVVFQNIEFEKITGHVLSIRENFPSGEPTANIPITNVTLNHVQGSMTGNESKVLEIICAEGGCSNWHFNYLNVTGFKQKSVCQGVPYGVLC